jgi:hypothetical protein
MARCAPDQSDTLECGINWPTNTIAGEGRDEIMAAIDDDHQENVSDREREIRSSQLSMRYMVYPYIVMTGLDMGLGGLTIN